MFTSSPFVAQTYHQTFFKSVVESDTGSGDDDAILLEAVADTSCGCEQVPYATFGAPNFRVPPSRRSSDTAFNPRVCQARVSLVSEVPHRHHCQRIAIVCNDRIQSNFRHELGHVPPPSDHDRLRTIISGSMRLAVAIRSTPASSLTPKGSPASNATDRAPTAISVMNSSPLTPGFRYFGPQSEA